MKAGNFTVMEISPRAVSWCEPLQLFPNAGSSEGKMEAVSPASLNRNKK